MWLFLVAIFGFVGLQGAPVSQKGLASGYTPYAKERVWVGRQRIQMSTGKPYCAWFGYRGEGRPVLAHRTWPCGTRVWVYLPRTKKGAWAVVMDRGPYGAIGHRTSGFYCGHRPGYGSEWCVKRPWRIVNGAPAKPDPGRWRGVADLSPPLRLLIDHNGWEWVKLYTTKLEIKRAWVEFRRRQPTS